MSRFTWSAAALLFALAASPLVAAELKPKPFDVEKLADGVYGFVWRDPLADPIEGNSLVVINDEDVLVVDAAMFPTTTKRFVAGIKKLTKKPVRFLVNTHWHDDHQSGNQVFRAEWPGVTIISQKDTRTDMIEQSINVRPQSLETIREQIPMYETWLKENKDHTGKELTPDRRVRVEQRIAYYQAAIPELQSLVPTPPDLTFERELILNRGGRVIEIRWLGLGNTRGDIVVFLPKERIAATGDLTVAPVPFAFGSYYAEWIKTLARVDSLEADILLPGHGPVMRDRAYLHDLQGLLGALVQEVGAAVRDSTSLEDTQKTVTLPEWRKKFANGDGARERAFDSFFLAPAVERAWRQARGEPDRVAR